MWTGRAKPPSGRAIRRWRGAVPAPGQARTIWGINGINYAKTFNDNMLVVVMIETPTGVANAYDIASVPGIDVVIIGNNDLSVFSGFAQNDDRYQAAGEQGSRRHVAGRQDLRPGQRQLRQGPSAQQGFQVLPERPVERRLDSPGRGGRGANPNAPPPGEEDRPATPAKPPAKKGQ